MKRFKSLTDAVNACQSSTVNVNDIKFRVNFSLTLS